MALGKCRSQHNRRTVRNASKMLIFRAFWGLIVSSAKQFALMVEAVYGSYSGEWNLVKVQSQLEEAIRLTIPNFVKYELDIINLISLTEITFFIVNTSDLSFD